MKKFFIPLLGFLLVSVLVGSCDKDEDPTPNIYGSWTVLQMDNNGLQYNVELKINTDNSYDWMLLEDVPGHSNSHAEFNLSGSIMSLHTDADCSSIGEYFITVESGKLSLIARSEECGPRASALEWVWSKMNK